ncbi:hypothetical protein EYB26_009103 [Talaromyces marneffei]|uniref:uncharacterized protein n=1 Tax=Talaromyces marneffei TaxID=37727 RepID=UPI0012A84A03|nr:uncharacterized protein EYB26_009103 [Talaromyces marneffei]QGA21393.1 hypothetical protein EYB26_009103 [Talaromyces marneffei]
MAPRKKKEKDDKESGDSGSALILEYLRKQNRPYSALDVSTNLHGKVTKTYTMKALKEMHERKEIEGRAAGKQMVYHAIQQVDANDTTGTKGRDPNQPTKDFEEKISVLKIREKDLREKLATINAVIPIPILKDQIANLEEKKALLGSQVSTLSAEMQKSSDCVCKEDFDRIDLEWRKWHSQVTSRKRIFLEFWVRCTEVLPQDMTPADLKETLGIEGIF